MNERWREIPGRPGYYQMIAPINPDLLKRPDEMIRQVMKAITDKRSSQHEPDAAK